MANDINRVFLIGRLTKDPELRYTQGGTSIGNFTIANNRTYSSQNERKEMVSFFNCIAWGKTGEVIAQHVKKGQRIAIEGRIQQRTWTDQSSQKRSVVEVIVESFQFLDSKPREGTGDYSAKETQSPQEDSAQASQGYYSPEGEPSPHFSDDDIPF